MIGIENKAMLVSLTIGFWEARKFDKKATGEVAAAHDTVAKDIGNFNKLLLSKRATGELERIARSARNYHRTNTLPWNEGYNLLVIEQFDSYSKAMREFSEQYTMEADRLEQELPGFIEEAQSRLKGLWNPGDYPSPEVVRDKYYFNVSIMPIPTTNDIRVSLQEDDIKEIKLNMESTFKEINNQIMRDLWGRLYAKVKNVSDKLGKDRDKTRIHDTLITHVLDLCELLPKLNVLEDAKLTSMIREVEKEVCRYDAEALRTDDDTRRRVAESSDRILSRIPQF